MLIEGCVIYKITQTLECIWPIWWDKRIVIVHINPYSLTHDGLVSFFYRIVSQYQQSVETKIKLTFFYFGENDNLRVIKISF